MAVYNNLLLDKAANDTAADFVRGKIAEIVKDPATRKIAAAEHPPDRHQAHLRRHRLFRRPSTGRTSTLVDIKTSPIEEITESAVRAARQGLRGRRAGARHRLRRHDRLGRQDRYRGRDGQTLNQKWAEGPRTYLGLMSAGFPNLFIITGPGSPSVLSNMIVSIEQHVDWIADCLA